MEKELQNQQSENDQKFWKKLLKFGKKIGEKPIYYSLLLYYTAKNPDVPKSSKMIIVGALSYLIFPVDLIPDFIPAVGLADDSAVIIAAVYKIVQHIDENIEQQAKEKLTTLFGEPKEETLKL